MTLCHYLLMTMEMWPVWSPTPVHMIVDKRSAVKWSPAHAEAIQTGNGGRCGVMATKLSNPRILYFPQSLTHPPIPAVIHTYSNAHTHIHGSNLPRLLVLYPPEVRVWYQPICSNHPHNPSSHSSTTPDPHSSFLLLPNMCHDEATTTPKHCGECWTGSLKRGSGRRVRWTKKREGERVKESSLDSSFEHLNDFRHR